MQNFQNGWALWCRLGRRGLPPPAEEESTMLTGKTATEIVEMMGFGWNLGNTLDATGGNTADVTAQEQSWGNAKITPELMVRVKEAGFDTIRIPVTWYRYTSDDGTYTIREDFLQQNAFMDVDSYSSHDRQMRLLALILDYDKLAREALTFQQFYAPGGKLRLRLPPVSGMILI